MVIGCECMPKKTAIEILLFKPDPAIPPGEKGVHENLRIKQRFEQYVSIGVFLEGSDLKYYFFEHADGEPKIYNSLTELKADLPEGLETVFEDEPKLFIMGHGHGGLYGLANIHGPSEQIYDDNFDRIIADFVSALPAGHDGNIFVTLEACNTDDQQLATEKGHEKTFLARVSAHHPVITFSGTGPWDATDVETGYRPSGGFPTLNAPVTSVGGGIWKHGNSVIFYHGGQQMAVHKSMFATTETAKELKINTVEYAREILKATSLEEDAKAALLEVICANRDLLRIEDLGKVPGFPEVRIDAPAITALLEQEGTILEAEKIRYITRVQGILERADAGVKLTDRDSLTITLGLKDPSVFEGHEDLRDKILANKALLQLAMVSCGKVLIAGPDNDGIINFLLRNGIGINSVDEKGMTPLHYAVQNFFNYRKEPLHLINVLLDCGADLEARDTYGRTPWMLATEHARDGRVTASGELLKLLEERQRATAGSRSMGSGAAPKWAILASTPAPPSGSPAAASAKAAGEPGPPDPESSLKAGSPKP